MPRLPHTPSLNSERSDSSRHVLCESYCRCEYREATVAHLLRQTVSDKSFSQSGLLGLSVGRDILPASLKERLLLYAFPYMTQRLLLTQRAFCS